MKVAIGIVSALLFLTVVAAITRGSDGGPAARDTLPLVSQPGHGPVQSATRTPTRAPAAERISPPPEADMRTYSGAGDDLVLLQTTEVMFLASLTHRGTSTFIVRPLVRNGPEQPPIVHAVGGYQGTVLVNGHDGKVLHGFAIKADGAWTLALKPVTLARAWTGGPVSGRGDEVLTLSPASPGPTTVRIEHAGSGNVTVHAYGDGSPGILVHEIGTYHGEVPLPAGTSLVTITTDGTWTLTRT
ncbi:hypothetical protein GCM10012289_21480 [Nonomuraea cavernae]|uniref:Uncharacterized protein n=1 Tax=Nonomuraea cavernae TaxID=2045107 RepID=A0A917YUY8_9ACTN|nr:hypothetical protein GCM10012289_21480 [Nonomuraea cavernae]